MCRELGASSQMLELGAYNEAKQAIIDSTNAQDKEVDVIKQMVSAIGK